MSCVFFFSSGFIRFRLMALFFRSFGFERKILFFLVLDFCDLGFFLVLWFLSSFSFQCHLAFPLLFGDTSLPLTSVGFLCQKKLLNGNFLSPHLRILRVAMAVFCPHTQLLMLLLYVCFFFCCCLLPFISLSYPTQLCSSTLHLLTPSPPLRRLIIILCIPTASCVVLPAFLIHL